MIRTILQAILLVFIGILVGQIPLGKSTLGRTAWKETQSLGLWGGGQLQSMVSYAGFGRKEASRPPTHREKTDPEGLTPSDRDAIRRILE